jgi:hypothetical protein
VKKVQEPRFYPDDPAELEIDVISRLLDDDENWRLRGDLLEAKGIYRKLYSPSDALRDRIETYNSKYSKDVNKNSGPISPNVGRIMEQIAYEVFQCLRDASTFKSIYTPDSQIDLVVTLAPASITRKILGIKGRKIVIECKNRKEAVDVKEFSRVVSILEYKYQKDSTLAIFFSRKGATGFPPPYKKIKVLKQALSIQMLYHARSGKYIVVFDHDDIQRLLEPGSLIKMILAKISEIEDTSGIKLEYDKDAFEVNEIPNYLSSPLE